MLYLDLEFGRRLERAAQKKENRTMTLFGIASGFVLLALVFLFVPRTAFAIAVGLLLENAHIIASEPSFSGGFCLVCVAIGIVVGLYIDIMMIKSLS